MNQSMLQSMRVIILNKLIDCIIYFHKIAATKAQQFLGKWEIRYGGYMAEWRTYGEYTVDNGHMANIAATKAQLFLIAIHFVRCVIGILSKKQYCLIP